MEKLVVSLNQRGIKFVNPSDTQEFVTLLQNLDKATSGATKYRMVALHAFDSVGQAVSRVASTIGSKLNSGAFGKAISTVKNFGNARFLFGSSRFVVGLFFIIFSSIKNL